MIKVPLTVLLVFLSLQSQAQKKTKADPWIEEAKQAFRDTKVSEAAEIVKKNQKKLLKNYSLQKQVAEWFTTFQYDSSLSLYEKLQEQALAQDVNADIEKGFKEILEKEPYNTLATTGYIKVLISKGKMSEAKEKIAWAQKEVPFLPIYTLFDVWMALKKEEPFEDKLFCEAGLLRNTEADFCYYIKVLGRLKDTRGKKGQQDEIRALVKKTAIPNAHYHLWLKWQKPIDKQKYLSSCQALSGKQKKEYFFVPEMCLIEEKERSE